MNIGFDAKRAVKNLTGLGNYSRSIIDLVAKKYTYTLFSPNFQYAHDWRPKGIYTKIEARGIKPLWRSYGLSKDIENAGVHLYHGLSHELPFGMKTQKIPTVVTMHDCIFKRFPRHFSFFDRKIFDLKWSYACSKADKIIAISHTTANDLMHFYDVPSHKIEIIPLFIPSSFRPYSKEELLVFKKKFRLPDDFFLFVGTHNPRKNVELILHTYRQHPALPPIYVIGSQSKWIRDFVNKNNLTEKIRFFETKVDDTELSKLYQLSISLLFPSLYEGFGLPILEAMQSGGCVICAHNSSQVEVGGNAPLYIQDTKSIKEMADQMKLLLKNKALQAELKEKGLHQSKSFSVSLHQKKLFTLYESLID